LAREAVSQWPCYSEHWKALGLAHLRAGNLQDAIPALEHSILLRRDGDLSAGFLLAVAHQRLGEPTGARAWFDRAAAWMDHLPGPRPEPGAFRAEAAALLGLEEPSSPRGSPASGTIPTLSPINH
jgi:hypothetical protein